VERAEKETYAMAIELTLNGTQFPYIAAAP